MPELVIQHDPVYGVLIDTLGDDPKAWADKMARERFPLEGREPTRKELRAMRARLQTLVEQQQARKIGTSLFAYTPLASPSGLLVDLAEPTDLSRVETPLGTAIRSLRHYRQESGPGLLAAVAYGWHLPAPASTSCCPRRRMNRPPCVRPKRPCTRWCSPAGWSRT
ncbi:MAG: hypothetical protein KY451_00065 [Actinobacteria bacterium]|nr:hypothetical protein [Actinomycetota bacterium]MBW3648004.1 hypothetical protein [Actinomycetota bacterium]